RTGAPRSPRARWSPRRGGSTAGAWGRAARTRARSILCAPPLSRGPPSRLVVHRCPPRGGVVSLSLRTRAGLSSRIGLGLLLGERGPEGLDERGAERLVGIDGEPLRELDGGVDRGEPGPVGLPLRRGGGV